MKCGWANQHVSIDSTGVFRPCCGWRLMEDEVVVGSIADYINSNWRKNLLETLYNNQWPEGCEDCKLDEEIDSESLRTGTSRYNDPDYKDAEVKFGNMCNLACAMCSPYNSSLIEKEYEKLKGQHRIFEESDFPVRSQWYRDPDKLKEIARELSSYNQIRFTGGEPTVNNYLIDFLTEVRKHNTDIIIKLTTNGNNWPSKLHELLKEFKTNISVSIDAYGEKNNYIRYPSNWNKIEKNIDKMLELPMRKIECGTTIASYNVHLMEELAQWVQVKGFQEHSIDPVWKPKIFRPCNTTQEIKNNFIEFSKTYEPTQRVLKNVLEEGNGLQETIDFLSILDHSRNINYKILDL